MTCRFLSFERISIQQNIFQGDQLKLSYCIIPMAVISKKPESLLPIYQA